MLKWVGVKLMANDLSSDPGVVPHLRQTTIADSDTGMDVFRHTDRLVVEHVYRFDCIAVVAFADSGANCVFDSRPVETVAGLWQESETAVLKAAVEPAEAAVESVRLFPVHCLGCFEV